jgi:hypothetical protein
MWCHGCEVKREYIGIDVLIQHKQKNRLYELQYSFQITLYRSVDALLEYSTPLPNKVHATEGRGTILHELARLGFTEDFSKLIQISTDDGHPFQKSCLFITNKINERDRDDGTSLILAI